MSEISKVVQVNITRQTQPISQKSFGVINIVGVNLDVVDGVRIQYFEALSGVVAALTGGTSTPEYAAALAIFSQNPTVQKIAISKKETTDADYSDALDEIKLVDNDWYGVILASRDVAEQEIVSTWVQANKKLMVVTSPGTGTPGIDNDILDEAEGVDVTSILHHVKNTSLFRTAAIYGKEAATKYSDAGLLAVILPKQPGTYTPAYKTIASIPADKITSTQSKNINDKYGSTYTELGGQNTLLFGKVGDGDYLDTIVFVDWLESKISESVFGLLKRSDKVPFTDKGIASIENEINKILSIPQNTPNGGIGEDLFDEDGNQFSGYNITVPTALSTPTNDKANRHIGNIRFTVWYTGSVHTVEISGVLTL